MRDQPLTGLSTDKSKQIIVARYREGLRWLKLIQNIPYIVYDKGDKTSSNHLPNIPRFPIQNFEGIKHAKSPTGRESHTYLYHILKYYDELADMNIFLQGNPVEFACDAKSTLRALLQTDFEGIDFLSLNGPLVICDKFASPLHRGLPMERIFKRLFKNDCPELFAYTWGAMFCVSKAYIQSRPRAFYEEMMQIVYDEPLSGYVFERLWPAILACHNYIPHDSYPEKDISSWQLPRFP